MRSVWQLDLIPGKADYPMPVGIIGVYDATVHVPLPDGSIPSVGSALIALNPATFGRVFNGKRATPKHLTFQPPNVIVWPIPDVYSVIQFDIELEDDGWGGFCLTPIEEEEWHAMVVECQRCSVLLGQKYPEPLVQRLKYISEKAFEDED